MDLLRGIEQAVADGHYQKARDLAMHIDLSEVGEKNKDYIEYMLRSFAVFGAKMANKRVLKTLPQHDQPITNAVTQFLLSLEHVVTVDLQDRIVQSIALAEQQQKDLQLASTLKFNPYHGEDGRFISSGELSDLAKDMPEQFQWLESKAKGFGYESAEHMLKVVPDVFDDLAKEWRKTHQLETSKADIVLGDLDVAGRIQASTLGRRRWKARKIGVHTLYVCRKLLNTDSVIHWAKQQGFTTTLLPDDLHTTICYSKKPIEWGTIIPEPYVPNLKVSGGKRTVEVLGGEGAVVLHFESLDLQNRWQEFRAAGASWEYDGYNPHLTISYNPPPGMDLGKVAPYTGVLEFGPEIYEPIDTDKDKAEKYNEVHDEHGRFATGSLGNQVEGKTGAIGALTVTVYRVGDPVDVYGRGVFYAGEREGADAYASIHSGKTTQAYDVTAQNVYVTTGPHSLYKELFPGKTFNDAVWQADKKSGFKSSVVASRAIEAKMAAKLKSMGHDALVYTNPPAPAKTELAVLNPKTAKVVSPASKADDGRILTDFITFGEAGDRMLMLTSGLMSSRVATYGFVAEAEHNKQGRYALSAVLDGRTSKFCRMIDGREFDLSTASSKIGTVLSVQDPEDLKTVQPWPDQDDESIAEYEQMSEDELVERGLNIPPFHPWCYLPGTRVYTKRGFIDFADVDIETDLFLALGIHTKQLYWVPAIKKIEYQYSGKAWNFCSTKGGVKQVVTDNHPMLWESREDKGKHGRLPLIRRGTIKTFVSADRHEAKIYCSSEHQGPAPESLLWAGKSVEAVALMRFFGYFLSEGNVKDDNCVSISQQKHFELMLSGLPTEFHVRGFRNSNKIDVRSPGLGNICRIFGHSHQKYVPEFIKDLSPELIKEFLLAYALGDGSSKDTGSAFFGYKSVELVFYTSSVRMRDDLCELLIRSGQAASFSLSTPKGTESKHKNGVYVSNHDVWLVRCLTSQSRACNQLHEFDYTGVVRDVELESHNTLLIEVDGKISWGSNCRTMCVSVEGGEEAPSIGVPDVEDPEVERGQSTVEDFEAVGQQVTEEQLKEWNDMIDTLPNKVLASMFGMSEKQILEAELTSGAIAFEVDGTLAFNGTLDIAGQKVVVGNILDPYTGKVYMNELSFIGGDPVAASAFMGRILSTMVDQGTSLGMTELVIQTGQNAYQYAQMGFLPQADDWQFIRMKLMDDLDGGSLAGVFNKLDDEQKSLLLNLLSNENEGAMGVLVDLPISVNGLSLGQILLDSIDAEFSLNLLDPAALSRAQQYL